jgi:hypothetical protein
MAKLQSIKPQNRGPLRNAAIPNLWWIGVRPYLATLGICRNAAVPGKRFTGMAAGATFMACLFAWRWAPADKSLSRRPRPADPRGPGGSVCSDRHW